MNFHLIFLHSGTFIAQLDKAVFEHHEARELRHSAKMPISRFSQSDSVGDSESGLS